MNANSIKQLLEKLGRHAYRHAYVAETVRTGLALQMRALREQRHKSQLEMGQILDKPQSVVSRLEDPDYGKVSVQTLLDIASALDVGLLIQFVAFPEFILRTRRLSPGDLEVASYDDVAVRNALLTPVRNFALPLAAGIAFSERGHPKAKNAVLSGNAADSIAMPLPG